MQTTQTNLLWAVRDTQNREAWVNFYRIYAPMLSHFARRLGLPDTDCDDVTQDVLVIAHKSLVDGVYDPARGRFRRWLYGIARRRILQAMRDRRRRTRLQTIRDTGGVDLLNQLEDPESEAAIEQLWEQEWRYALLDEALRHVQQNIGEKTYQAFILYARENRAVDDVAQLLGISPSSVYVYKQRVLEAIRQWIGQFEGEE